MQTRVAVISMILEAGSDVAGVNTLLHEFAPYILGRMGIPYRARAINIISVAIEEEAIAEPHPNVSNFTSVIISLSIFR